MLTFTKWFRLLSLSFLATLSLISPANSASENMVLHTPNMNISVPPGESVSYLVDIINKGTEMKKIDLSVTGMPRGWIYSVKSGRFNVSQVSVLPGEKMSLTLNVDIPLQVNKGSYPFTLVAKGFYSLPLVIQVSEQGTYATEFTTRQANMEGHATSNFTFNAELKNRTPEKQLYSLRAKAPLGWSVIFKPEYTQATSANVEANSASNISIEVKPPDRVEAGIYKIPVSAGTSSTSAEIELEVVITGHFGMELTTPAGLLSTNITAGEEKRIELLIRNTGTIELKDLKLQASSPANWNVTFEPASIAQLAAGNNVQVFAILKADKKAIPGDYIVNLEARVPEVSSRATFRVSVKTSMVWGWVGILVISVALGSVYYLFRKYGRR